MTTPTCHKAQIRSSLTRHVSPTPQLTTKVIPLELWIEILRGLDGLDVLRLAQLSRSFHAFLSTRSIWTLVLQWTCEMYDLFEPSYPIDEMDLLHIQRVCVGPSLWKSLVEEHAVSIDELTSRCPSMQPTSSMSPVHQIEDGSPVCFIPGGRFLVALASAPPSGGPSTRGTLLRIWDVGVAGAPVLDQPALIGEVDTGIPWSGSSMEVKVFYSSRRSLWILVSIPWSDRRDPSRMHVYGAEFPESGSLDGGMVPLVRRTELVLPETSIRRNWSMDSFLGSRILLCSQPFVFVWDFVEGTYACTRIATAGDKDYFIPLFFDGSSYCVLKQENMDIGWMCSVPELSPLPPRFEGGMPPYTLEEPYDTFPVSTSGFSTTLGSLSFRDRSFLAPTFPIFWDIGHSTTPRRFTPSSSLTRYVFRRRAEVPGGPQQGEIVFESVMQATFKEPLDFRFSSDSEGFGPQFSSSRLLRVPVASTSVSRECIYSLVPLDAAPCEQLKIGDTGTLQREQPGAVEEGGSMPLPCSAALMVTPLFKNWAFRNSCIASGRLLHQDGRGEYFLADYLW